MEAPREAIHNQAFNVGATEENYRVSELAEIVEQVLAVDGPPLHLAWGHDGPSRHPEPLSAFSAFRSFQRSPFDQPRCLSTTGPACRPVAR